MIESAGEAEDNLLGDTGFLQGGDVLSTEKVVARLRFDHGCDDSFA